MVTVAINMIKIKMWPRMGLIICAHKIWLLWNFITLCLKILILINEPFATGTAHNGKKS